MDAPKTTIPVNFVRSALRGARQHGVDVAAILAQAGIAEEVLSSSMARVSTGQYVRLMQGLWATMQDEFVGFCADRPCKLGTFAMMCYTTIHCGTLERALNRGTLFYRLITDAFNVSLRREGDRATVVFDNLRLDDPDHFLTECWLVIWHGYACWLTGKRIPLLDVSFTHAEPPHVVEYHKMFFAPASRFNAECTSLSFAASYLHAPIVQNEATLKQFLVSSPADLLVRPKNDDSLTGRIRAILRAQAEFPEFSQVASDLCMTPQTLRRRLKDEGSSYQQIKDHVRRDMAIYFLSRPELSFDDIAGQLGFSEPSAFHRAFKKWTGLTPGVYRQEKSGRIVDFAAGFP